jgi:hypothetical protein
MGKSINPMCFLFHTQGEVIPGSAPGPIVLMSLQPAIPWRVALLHCPPPLHRLDHIYHSPAETVNHHLMGAGEFSTGIMGNFQPVLTRGRSWIARSQLAWPSGGDGRVELAMLGGRPVGPPHRRLVVAARSLDQNPVHGSVTERHRKHNELRRNPADWLRECRSNSTPRR